MTTEEKIYKKIKNAAEKETKTDFLASEKIWGKVTTKLDNNTLKKEKNYWKKGAVAAVFLLVGTVIYMFLNTENQKITPDKIVFESDSLPNKNRVPEVNQPVVEQHHAIKENSAKIIQNKITIQQTIVLNDTFEKVSLQIEETGATIAFEEATEAKKTDISIQNSMRNAASASSGFLANRKSFEVEGNSGTIEATAYESDADSNTKDKKNDLVVIDGKLSNKTHVLNQFEDEGITKTPNPIYYINGEEYTKNQLFGSGATGKYVPLKQQNITSIMVLEPEKAVKIYGEKGKNGIVILTISQK
jgi:hypothetical protein